MNKRKMPCPNCGTTGIPLHMKPANHGEWCSFCNCDGIEIPDELA